MSPSETNDHEYNSEQRRIEQEAIRELLAQKQGKEALIRLYERRQDGIPMVKKLRRDIEAIEAQLAGKLRGFT